MTENHPKDWEMLELSVGAIIDRTREVYGHKIKGFGVSAPKVCGQGVCVAAYGTVRPYRVCTAQTKSIFRCFKAQTKSN